MPIIIRVLPSRFLARTQRALARKQRPLARTQDATASDQDSDSAAGSGAGAHETGKFAFGLDPSEFQQAFACEIEPAKRAYLETLTNKDRRARVMRLVCIFGDVCLMGRGRCDCYAHKRDCNVADVFFF